jgi:cell division initiation protein
MAQITPSELSEREFTRSIRGYNTSEVDAYINRIVENYAILYRENIELSKRLAELEEKQLSLSAEEELIRKTLETARKAGDSIIADAYNRSDEILASVKTGCDSILHNFRDKVESQKAAISEMQKNVKQFKNELFEKYRLHVELIEQLTPMYEYEEELSPDEYVSHIVSNLKQEVTAQYDISVDTVPTPNADALISEYESLPTVELTKATDELLAVYEAAKNMIVSDKTKKKKDAIPSVTSLLDETDDIDMTAYEDNFLEETLQFQMNEDAAEAENPSRQ